MANKYWVGGTGTWDTTAGTKWATTSGGAGGAAVPSTADVAIFDGNSNPGGSGASYTVTRTATTGVQGIRMDNPSAGALTFAGTSAIGITTAGMSITGTINWTNTGTITFTGTTSVCNTGTTTINSPVTISGSGITVTLNGAFATAPVRTTTLTTGTLNLNNFTLTTGGFVSTNSNTRTINFGTSGIIEVSGAGGTVWSTSTITNLTISGTPTINLTSALAGVRIFTSGALAEASSFNVNVTAGTGSVTTSTSRFKNLDFTGFSGTWAPTTGTIYGSLTLGAGQIVNPYTSLTFAATSTGKTITSNGVTLNGPVTFDGVGGGWTFQDALTLPSATGIITLTNGSLDTNGVAVTADSISSNNSNTRVLSLGASAVSLTSNAPVVFTTTTGLTFNSGTSTIALFGVAAAFNGADLTYYNVEFGSAFSAGSAKSITGTNTYNNLTFVDKNGFSIGVTRLLISGLQTVNDTFTVLGSDGAYRYELQCVSGSIDAANVSLRDVDFANVINAGSNTWTGTRLGDLGGNSTNITLDAPKNVYWNLAGTQAWGVIGWAGTSGGTPDVAYFPLAQDTAIFDDVGAADTINADGYFNIGSIDASARTSAMTLNLFAKVYGDFILGPGLTMSGSSTITFSSFTAGRTINTAGKTITQPLTFSGSGGWTLAAAMTTSNTITHSLGTLDLNDFVITCLTFASSVSAARTIAFGTGRIDVTSTATATVYNVNATGLTVTGTHTVRATGSANLTRTITISNASLFTGTAIPSISVTAGSASVILSTAAIMDFNTTGSSGAITIPAMTVYGNLILAGRTSLTSGGALTFAATSTGKTVNLNGLVFSTSFTFNGVGGEWTLASATTCGALTLTNGSLITGNFSVTCTSFTSSNTNTRGLSLGSTTFSCSGNWDTSTTTGLTFNAGTSVINMSSTTGTFNGGGLTYYNFQFTSTSVTSVIMYGTNSFFNFITYARGSAGLAIYNILDDITVRNTLTLGSGGTTNSNRRSMISGYLDATSIADYTTNPSHVTTITANAIDTINNIDFRNIIAAGASGTWSGTRVGDCGGNSNITTETPKTVYAVGGSLTAYESTNWSTSSGGATNAVNFPLPQDTAVINDSSGTGTLTFTSAANYNVGTLDMSTRTVTVTLNTSGALVRVYGNLTLFYSLGSGSNTSVTYFCGPNDQTMNKFFLAGTVVIAKYDATKSLTFTGAISTSDFYILRGGLNTAGFSFTASLFDSSTDETRSIFFGASTVTLSGNYTMTGAGITFNSDTSTISLTPTSPRLTVDANRTFYDISFTSTALSQLGGLGLYAVNSSYTTFYTITCNNLTFAAQASTGCPKISIDADITVNGTFTINGGASVINRISLYSINRISTITAAVVGTFTNTDFVGITAAGAAGTWSGTSLGDGGRNSNITFTAPKTVYWNLTGNRSWSATAWATTSAGTPALANFPLAQDTAIFTNTGVSAGNALTINSNWFIGTLDYSARTTASTITNTSYSFGVTGSITLSSTTTVSSTGSLWLSGDGTQNITTNGVSITWLTYINCNGTVVLLDNMTNTNATGVYLSSGTFDLNGFSITIRGLRTSGPQTKTFNMGSGSVIMNNSLANARFDFSGGSNITVVPATSMITTNGGGFDWFFYGGGYTYNSLVQNFTPNVCIFNDNTFDTLSNSFQPTGFLFGSGSTTTVNNFNISGTAGNLVDISSYNQNDGPHTLSKASGTVDVSYCAIYSSTATGGATWNALLDNGNVNGGGNSGWIFSLFTFVKSRFLVFF